jgi:RHS repeat-associated protein
MGRRGETRQVTGSTGTVTDTYLYNAYGKQLASSGTNTTPHRYGGKYGYYNDGGVGLILAQQRWYSSALLRWMGRDAAHYSGGENLYGYVSQNPMKYFDSTGFQDVPMLDPTDPIGPSLVERTNRDKSDVFTVGGHGDTWGNRVKDESGDEDVWRDARDLKKLLDENPKIKDSDYIKLYICRSGRRLAPDLARRMKKTVCGPIDDINWVSGVLEDDRAWWVCYDSAGRKRMRKW